MEEGFFFNDYGIDLLRKHLDSIKHHELSDSKIRVFYRKIEHIIAEIESDIEKNSKTFEYLENKGKRTSVTESLFNHIINQYYSMQEDLEEMKEEVICNMSDFVKASLGIEACLDDCDNLETKEFVRPEDIDMSHYNQYDDLLERLKVDLDLFKEYEDKFSHEDFLTYYEHVINVTTSLAQSIHEIDKARNIVDNFCDDLGTLDEYNMYKLLNNQYASYQLSYNKYQTLLEDITQSSFASDGTRKAYEYTLKYLHKLISPVEYSDVKREGECLDYIIDAYELLHPELGYSHEDAD